MKALESTLSRRNFCRGALFLASIVCLGGRGVAVAASSLDEPSPCEEYRVVNGWVLTASDLNTRV